MMEYWNSGIVEYLNPAIIPQKAVIMPVLLSPWTRFRVSGDAETILKQVQHKVQHDILVAGLMESWNDGRMG
jgi:hypothetical protein